MYDVDLDLVSAIDAGDAFGCPDCHEVSDGSFCADCHVGNCEGCGVAVAHADLGSRAVDAPELMWCRDCTAGLEDPWAPDAPPAPRSLCTAYAQGQCCGNDTGKFRLLDGIAAPCLNSRQGNGDR